MKKIFLMLAILATAGVVNAEMDDQAATFTLIGTNSDTKVYVLRGDFRGVYVDVASGGTNTVTVTDEYGQTLFSKASIAADTFFPVVAIPSTTAGATVTNIWYTYLPVAGEVTLRAAGVVASTVTNAVTVRVIYDK